MSCQDLRTRLQKAQVAYDDLILGKSVRVLVDQNGERVEFTSANVGRLSAYISWLADQVARHCGDDTSSVAPPPPSGPLRFYF